MGSAHPRSRGENGFVSSAAAASVGSSPLTRGKRGGCSAPRADTWLIPAHAGKTPPGIDVERPCRAHPRSRGENTSGDGTWSCPTGSSPLTRGKQAPYANRRTLHGLIPAHAGKTISPVLTLSMTQAHPRSRGENVVGWWGGGCQVGSSPLTRGKLGDAGARTLLSGLIPAHAGKTLTNASQGTREPAHPRSRGENFSTPVMALASAGSSPLTRGKLDAEGPPALRGRLIPAHAGKTSAPCRSRPGSRAHPRSRGENGGLHYQGLEGGGSSPLTRGKRGRARRGARPPRLIPAHAGKTSRVIWSVMSCPAHPRSRGEND